MGEAHPSPLYSASSSLWSWPEKVKTPKTSMNAHFGSVQWQRWWLVVVVGGRKEMRINMNGTCYSSFDVHVTLHTWTLNLKRNQSPIPTNTNLSPPSHYTTGQRTARKHDTAQGARLRRDKKRAMGWAFVPIPKMVRFFFYLHH